MRHSPFQLPKIALLLAVLLGGCQGAPPGSCPEGYWLDEEDLCRLVEPEPPGGDDWPWGDVEGACGGEEDLQAWTDPFPRCTSTYQGDLRIRSPEDMAAFCADYDCVAGGVDIGATETGRDEGLDSIVDLEPLSCLREARYVFISETPNLREVHLPQLRRTGGGFSVITNPSLESVSLPVLGEVGGDLSLQANGLLSELYLPRLHDVLEFLFIVNNPSLATSLAHDLRDQLCSDHVGGAITIVGNGHGAVLGGHVRREAESPSGSSGELFVTVFSEPFGGGGSIMGIYNATDVDLGPEGASFPYVVSGLEPRSEPYFIEAFLDTDDSGPTTGASTGDLRTAEGISVLCEEEGLVQLDLILSELAP